MINRPIGLWAAQYLVLSFFKFVSRLLSCLCTPHWEQRQQVSILFAAETTNISDSKTELKCEVCYLFETKGRQEDKLVVCKQGLCMSAVFARKSMSTLCLKIKCCCTLDSTLTAHSDSASAAVDRDSCKHWQRGSSDILCAAAEYKFRSISNLWDVVEQEGGSDYVMKTSCEYGARSLRGMFPVAVL